MSWDAKCLKQNDFPCSLLTRVPTLIPHTVWTVSNLDPRWVEPSFDRRHAPPSRSRELSCAAIDAPPVGTDAADDTLGLKCPIGSHIRRNNPRNEAIVGAGSPHHRIVRRGMPYGPPYDPAHPDAEPRGLIGYFINASLTNQFEFLTSQ